MSYTIKNASDLKFAHESENPDSYFFDRKSMRFFGDTMGNYACSSKTVMINGVECYELRRKKPVKHGLIDSAFFDAKTFERVHNY